MAEWLGRGLQNLLQQFESARYLYRSPKFGAFFKSARFDRYSMKYSQWIGIIAALALCVAAFYNWTYHPDLKKYFTGFFSEQNMYGKPGKLMIGLSIIAILMFALKKVWAKRVNWIICAILAAYVLKTYILFTTCYRGICPVKQPAIFVMLFAPVVMIIMAFLPELPRAVNSKTS